MKFSRLLMLLLAIGFLANGIPAQAVTINNPVIGEPAEIKLTIVQRNIMNRVVLPKVRKKLAGGICEESFEPAGVIEGSFSRPKASQTIIFYQFCQTGNGFGTVGLVLIENDKVVGNYLADAGWSTNAKMLPDINRNGVDEFALYYSGGLHQGQGGIGVDLLEFSPTGIKGFGWFQAESFSDDDAISYKVTVMPGPTPAFFREKFVSTSSGKWRRQGRPMPLKLTKSISKFQPVK